MPYRDKREQTAYQNERLKKRRLDWLMANGPCAKCGSTEALQVDHIDPSTKTTHRVWSLGEDRRNAELAKCQVLCAQCHAEKTKVQIGLPLIHGTKTGYSKKGCRCPDCTAAVREYNRNRRIRTGKR